MEDLKFSDSYIERRTRVLAGLSSAALVVPAAQRHLRNNDVHHAFRQDSNLYYLTGLEEENSVLLLLGGQNPKSILFVMPKDPVRETWDGFRFGPERAKEIFGVDEAYSIADFKVKAPALLSNFETIYYTFYTYSEFDRSMDEVLVKVRELRKRLSPPAPQII
ncbi:MAG: aminopeptidase P N-terminal domain-containing protein, partial [Bdellovibrionales bacterium]|nr:aminopeptidase P N-terminal domain-containing protein [Bdellovibrionales bacterium]